MHPVERGVNFLMAAVCVAISILMWPTMVNPGQGLPSKTSLISYSGTLSSWNYKHVTRNRKDIAFALEDKPNEFVYVSKGRGYNEITQSLRIGAKIVFLGKPYSGNLFNRTPKGIGVYEISVDGSTIRSYEEVEEAWKEDDKLTPYLLVLFAVGFLLFMIQGITGQSLTKRKQG